MNFRLLTRNSSRWRLRSAIRSCRLIIRTIKYTYIPLLSFIIQRIRITMVICIHHLLVGLDLLLVQHVLMSLISFDHELLKLLIANSLVQVQPLVLLVIYVILSCGKLILIERVWVICGHFYFLYLEVDASVDQIFQKFTALRLILASNFNFGCICGLACDIVYLLICSHHMGIFKILTFYWSSVRIWR